MPQFGQESYFCLARPRQKVKTGHYKSHHRGKPIHTLLSRPIKSTYSLQIRLDYLYSYMLTKCLIYSKGDDVAQQDNQESSNDEQFFQTTTNIILISIILVMLTFVCSLLAFVCLRRHRSGSPSPSKLEMS